MRCLVDGLEKQMANRLCWMAESRDGPIGMVDARWMMGPLKVSGVTSLAG